MPESVVLLHGFGGTHHAWDGVVARLPPERYLPRAIDLPGHGRQEDPGQAITFAACVDWVLARAPKRFTLCGYSLGGRIALHVALAAPERVGRLLLISTTAGIENPRERATRRASDRRLADELERLPYERFIERWQAQPLFAGDPPEVLTLARAELLRNRPAALATVLRGIGSGEMTPLWDRLSELEMPVALLAGDRDEKFQALARRMRASLPDATLRIVPGGHRVALENPAAVARALQERAPLELQRLDAEAGSRG